MKKLIILLTLISINLHAQDGISFSVLQDVKLGLGLDKTHGNTTPTLDVLINMNWEGKQYEYYYFAIQTQFEKANLYGDNFYRYGVNGIWNFNKLIVPKLKIGFGVGLGIIHRENNSGFGSYSGTLELSYPIAKNLAVIIKNEWVRRSDLPTPKTGYNLAAGITFKPIHL